ncbi:hypothetical protein [Parendozoicomonas sp. Alg238-R29]|uniref:hypothetical protein n=1 Tax=Parendozoicomonas sp. Alg238-R29 TaxID=2993446 RepID=UPI00248E4AF5|nr:hypothetical protein [Parendozoicomonas sp. Alg238-R29]
MGALIEDVGPTDSEDVYCDDMSVPVINGTYLQAIGLGEQNYLLADHTDSQNLALPEIWFGNGLASGLMDLL